MGEAKIKQRERIAARFALVGCTLKARDVLADHSLAIVMRFAYTLPDGSTSKFDWYTEKGAMASALRELGVEWR